MTTDELCEAIGRLFDRVQQQNARLEAAVDERGKLIAEIVGAVNLPPLKSEAVNRPIHD